ncbi:MAG: hypothetical protein DRJ65_10850 [Acidobacteria bacterium]|nr:MAG: hypothetical protein DRJ65_10850 [Acidobacteriota bacterium]
MKNQTAIGSLVLFCALAMVTPALADDTPQPTEIKIEDLSDGQVIRTVIQRSTAKRLTAEEQDQLAPTIERFIKARKEKLEKSDQHPWMHPVPNDRNVNPDDVVPRNPEVVPGRSVAGTDPLSLFVNTITSSVSPANSSTVNEPSVVASNDRVHYTANWYSATSDNLGDTFTYVNPFSGPFAAPSGEFMCCDQTTAFDPNSNTIFWLQQYIPNNFTTPSTNTGTQRINVDQDSDGTWDCAYDINTVNSGFSDNTWFDFPDLVVSDNYLWHASNVFNHNPHSFVGGYSARYPLAELSQCSGSLTINAFTTNHGSLRFVRGADTTMYFADHNSTAQMILWTWPDADDNPTSVNRSITGWLNSTRICGSPDGREWCGGMDSRIQSGFKSGSTIGFMWTASQGGGFTKPYTRISTFDTSNNLSHIEDIDIWSSTVGFVHASSAVNSNGQIGGTILWGGASDFQSCSAWMAESPSAAGFSPFDTVTALNGTSGPSSNRSGDYLMSATYYPNTQQFVGACFALTSTSRSQSRFLHFGRESSTILIFSDGFEDGTMDQWSSSIP